MSWASHTFGHHKWTHARNWVVGGGVAVAGALATWYAGGIGAAAAPGVMASTTATEAAGAVASTVATTGVGSAVATGAATSTMAGIANGVALGAAYVGGAEQHEQIKNAKAQAAETEKLAHQGALADVAEAGTTADTAGNLAYKRKQQALAGSGGGRSTTLGIRSNLGGSSELG